MAMDMANVMLIIIWTLHIKKQTILNILEGFKKFKTFNKKS